MIIFLYGSDTYRSRQKLNKIIEGYKKIHKSGLNFSTLDFEESDFRNFKQSLESASMFKEKKLIVLKNLFSRENIAKSFFDYLESSKISDSQKGIIIIYEKEIRWREFKGIKSDLFNKLKKQVQSQEFNLLEGFELKNWIKKEFSLKNIKINPPVLEKLILYIGNDLWQMENEISKLILFKAKNQKPGTQNIIEEKDIDLLVRPKIEINIFKIIDAVASKNKKLALRLVQEYYQEGEDENYLLSMILWQIRNLVKVKSRYQSANGIRMMRPDKVAKELKMHPYVVEKTILQAKNFTLAELKKIYQKLLEVDYKIKTGKIGAKTALDLFIAEIC